MKTLCTILLLALLTPVITAQESSSPAVGELGANARFKQDDYAANVAARNVEEHPEHDMQGLTGAMKSQQDAGMAAAENVLENDSFDNSGISKAGKQPYLCSDSSIENTVSALEAPSKRF